MTTRTVRIGNKDTVTHTVLGWVILPGTYIGLTPSDLPLWADSSEAFTLIGQGKLVVNRGQDLVDDIADPLEGWKWLAGDPDFGVQDSRGRAVVVVAGSEEDTTGGKVSGSILFSGSLASGTTWSRVVVAEPGSIIFVKRIVVHSKNDLDVKVAGRATDPVNSEVWDVLPDEVAVAPVLLVDGNHSAGSSTVSVKWPTSDTSTIRTDIRYRLGDQMAKVTSFDSGNMTLTLDRALTSALSDGDPVIQIQGAIADYKITTGDPARLEGVWTLSGASWLYARLTTTGGTNRIYFHVWYETRSI